MSHNRMKRETRLSIVKHLVKEQKAFIVAMAGIHPDYVEGNSRCDASLAHLEKLEAEVTRLETLTGGNTNPLKYSKRL